MSKIQKMLRNTKQPHIIDLTYSFSDKTIFWPTENGFVFEKGREGYTEKGYYYCANRFSTPEHGGTHIDAPIHFRKGGRTLDEIPLKNLIGDAILVDVSEKCSKDKNYQVSAEDFIQWEKANGKIPKLSIILLKTGFGKFWPDRKKYLGTDKKGIKAIEKLYFPGLHLDGAKWLIKNRNVKAVGIDTASIDYGQSTYFKTHQELLKNEVLIFENLANLDKLPNKGFNVIALPIKIKGGSGGPLRIIAVVK